MAKRISWPDGVRDTGVVICPAIQRMMSIREVVASIVWVPDTIDGNEVRSIGINVVFVFGAKDVHASITVLADGCDGPVKRMTAGLCLTSCRIVSLPSPLVPPMTKMVLPCRSGTSFSELNFMVNGRADNERDQEKHTNGEKGNLFLMRQ